LTYAWFDHFLKGEDNGFLTKQPRVQYYEMGANKWKSAKSWPPEGAKEVKLSLTSGGHANTLMGDGKIVVAGKDSLLKFASAPAVMSQDMPDTFTYDPMHPTPSYGGNVCCAANTIPGNGGALDQRKMESRDDILVYTSEPLAEGAELSGPITVTYYVSSDVKDTDVTAKLIDVLPDGTAYNLDETIQRLRYREGDDKVVMLEKGKVYKVTLTPMNTSNYFEAGHRIRLEVAGANFPRFDRNLNTGGNNYDETTGVVAHTSIHHSAAYPSTITVTVVPGSN
jgi:putative CocE/NonD family hydrolase